MTYDGVPDAELARRIGATRLHVLDDVGSTQDVAHALAGGGAPAGTVVLADAQHAGRGRQGRHWRSERGRGVWMTVVERPTDREAVEVLSLRLGLHLSAALDPFAPAPVGLKWPNDLLLPAGKLAGVLVEARWRDARLDWVAVGVGLNVRPPVGDGAGGHVATGLREGTRRVDVLERLVPAVRAAAAVRGALTADELEEWAARDAVRARRCTAPVAGVVEGIDASGALLVRTPSALEQVRAGSLLLEEAPC